MPHYAHIEGVKVAACFSKCGKYRYRLDIEKDDAQKGKCVCVIMQNPSEAGEEKADKTVQFLEKLIFEKDYEEFSEVKRIIIVNQFAHIQTGGFNGAEEHIGPDNDMYIQRAINESDIVLVAWGKDNNYGKRISVIDGMIGAAKGKTLLQTKKHPSRGFYEGFIEQYTPTLQPTRPEGKPMTLSTSIRYAALFACLAALCIAADTGFAPRFPMDDSYEYIHFAAQRTSFYPLIIAALGGNLNAVVYAQCAVYIATMFWLIHTLHRRFNSHLITAGFGLAVSCNPFVWPYHAAIMSESLTLSGMNVLLIALLNITSKESNRYLLSICLAGLCAGVLAGLRPATWSLPAFPFLTLACLLWLRMVLSSRQRGAPAAPTLPARKSHMRKFTPKAGKDAYATGLYRYWLTRDVPGSEGLAAADGTTSKLKDMIFIGMKPSTADQHVDDPTVERCLDFARRFKCHRLIVLNLFACWREKEWSGDSIGPENDDFIREICDSSDGRDKLIIVGWGRDDRCKGRDEKVLELIRSVGGEVYCFRKNSDGSPSQPISLSPHVPDDFRPIPYP